MADRGFLLSQGDVDALRHFSVLASKRTNLHDPGKVDHEEQPGPEVHIFYVPSGGISALYQSSTPGTGTTELQDDVPGFADCEVWRILDDTIDFDPVLAPVPDLTYRVYNIWDNDIPGLSLVIAQRDKFGTWIVQQVLGEDVGTGSGTSGGSSPTSGAVDCELAGVNDTDCIKVIGPENTVYLVGSGGIWSSTENLTYFDGHNTGAVEFNFSRGSMHLSVGGLELVNCGNGCFKGGPITGHDEDFGTGSPIPQTACAGRTFQCCISCTCCSIPGWGGPGWYCVHNSAITGTGTLPEDCIAVELLDEDRCDTSIEICSGPYDTEEEADLACMAAGTGSGTSPPVSIECCDPPPGLLLYAHFSGALAEMGTVTLTGGPFPLTNWSGASSCGGFAKAVTLNCISGSYQFSVSSTDPWDMSVASCTPFSMSGTTGNALHCPGASSVVIDENP